jgi:hypothetical protein
MQSPDFAETLALEALGWIAAQEDLLGVFLGASGAGQHDLRARVQDPEFLAAVLDFLLMEDGWVLNFAASRARRPEDVLRARQALPGGDLPNWT